MKFLPAKISISRPQGTGCDYISIELEDESSRVQFLEVHIDLKDFTEAITGMGHVPCTAMLRFTESVGKVREHKTEFVPLEGYGATKEAIEAALAPFEVDGWKGSRSDATNHHRAGTANGVRGYTVAFNRLVDPEPVEQ